MEDERTFANGRSTDIEGTNWSRRHFLNASVAAGVGAVALGASTSASAQSADGTPSVEDAAAELSHPDPSEEAIALYRYLHDEQGERILSGQQYEPEWDGGIDGWDGDEFGYVEDVTGQLPAVMGVDFIHADNSLPVEWALEWWERGGIVTAMWHWGAPGLEEPEDEYEQSNAEYIGGHDPSPVFEEGTDDHEAFRQEMEEVGDALEELRDAGVPVLWRPFHEFDGEWFWWGFEGPEFFVDLWETMHEYYVEERNLDNLVWVLSHSDHIDAAWVPDASTYDLAGTDTYADSPTYSWLYDDVAAVHGEDRPLPLHEVGVPPHPEECAETGTWWSWWMQWHIVHLVEETDEDYLDEVYNHDLTVTLEDVPDIVAEYGGEAGGLEVDGYEPQDTIGDGLYDDFTGDGRTDHEDVTAFFEHLDDPAVQENHEYFDFVGNGRVGFNDVLELFRQ